MGWGTRLNKKRERRKSGDHCHCTVSASRNIGRGPPHHEGLYPSGQGVQVSHCVVTVMRKVMQSARHTLRLTLCLLSYSSLSSFVLVPIWYLTFAFIDVIEDSSCSIWTTNLSFHDPGIFCVFFNLSDYNVQILSFVSPSLNYGSSSVFKCYYYIFIIHNSWSFIVAFYFM